MGVSTRPLTLAPPPFFAMAVSLLLFNVDSVFVLNEGFCCAFVSGFRMFCCCFCSYCGPIPAGSVWLSIKVFKSFGSRTGWAYATAHNSQLTAHHRQPHHGIQELAHRCLFRGPFGKQQQVETISVSVLQSPEIHRDSQGSF